MSAACNRSQPVTSSTHRSADVTTAHSSILVNASGVTMSNDDDVPPYIPVPLAATPILPPSDAGMQPADAPRPAPGSTQAAAAAVFAPGTAPFPPPPSAPPARKLMPSTTSLSTNVSDLVLSSLLPANLPKLPSANHPPGRARELTSQREGLGLNVMSNNFRRFVTKVGSGRGYVLAARWWRMHRRTMRLFLQSTARPALTASPPHCCRR